MTKSVALEEHIGLLFLQVSLWLRGVSLLMHRPSVLSMADRARENGMADTRVFKYTTRPKEATM